LVPANGRWFSAAGR